MSSIDLSQPLATLLRETTRHAHEKAERSSGATTLVSGKLSLDDYIRQLMMLWYIYELVSSLPLILCRIPFELYIAFTAH